MKHMGFEDDKRFQTLGCDTYVASMHCIVLKANQPLSEAMQLPKTGVRYLLTGEHRLAQTKHKDFTYEQGRNPYLFLLVTRPDQRRLEWSTVRIGKSTTG